MGGANGKLSQKKVKKLSEKTGFTRDEIVTWYSGFLSDCPSGKLTKREFTKVYSGFFPHGDSKAFSEFIFAAFDRNGDGSIEFAEFLEALAITSKGSFQQKLEWAFNLYDIDGNGQISKDEMVRIISAVFAMVGSHKKIELTAEEKVDQMFESMDLDGNAEISKEEFFEGARHDKSVVEALGGMI